MCVPEESTYGALFAIGAMAQILDCTIVCMCPPWKYSAKQCEVDPYEIPNSYYDVWISCYNSIEI